MEFDPNRIMPLGVEGELCVRTPSLLKGYWNMPDATGEGLVDGWLRTGDIGMISEIGTIHFSKTQGNAQGEGHERLPFGDRIRAGPACGGDRERRDRPRGRGARTGSRRLVTGPPERRAGTTETALEKAPCRERLAVYKIPKSGSSSPCR